jgi:NADPH:quinone reductase-like Zn-dependent oxidoreductase
VISAVGEGVTRFKVGDRVLASTGWGGFAEKLALEEGRCTHIPDDMPFDEAAAFVLTYGTSYYALKDRGRLKAGETLLVLGAAGGVGLAAVELGKAMGVRVIAAGLQPGEDRPGHQARRRQRRRLSARPVRQGRSEGPGRPDQGSLRPEWLGRGL